jgi:hypothetical protein
MASDIDEIFYDVDADVGGRGEPRLYERPTRVVTTAHPFTEDDLRAFAASGEHPGLD